MQLTIDSDNNTLFCKDAEGERHMPLYCDEAFKIISNLWVKAGWNAKYLYTFSWMGRPIIQFPEDLVRVQEMIFQLKPDVILETGVAHGGSLIFYASLFEAMRCKGRVIGIDIEIRPHNRAEIEAHPLFDRITLIEGSSVDTETLQKAHALIAPGQKVLVILDSNHLRDHVRAELEAYCDLVCPGSYIVATDGVMREVADIPRGTPSWIDDNPSTAAREFAEAHPEFELTEPPFTFNESTLDFQITHWPGAWLRRR
ncbi:MAG: cephalosporin hydroxylase family protein [Verrucomicrobia bacterium]|nr:cephalosporin hydroxylase family protein [Verrucomicrobiota bacterium]